jgi:hypothetical protein
MVKILIHMGPWSNEILVGRPQQDERRRRGARSVQVGDRSPLRGEPLFCQTLRQDGQQRGVLSGAHDL